MWWSPNSEFFQPPKEWYPTGTGIGTLTPTMPAWTSSWKRRGGPPPRGGEAGGVGGGARGAGHAALAGRAVGGRHGGVGGLVEVGVGEHEHVVFRPAEGLHTLAVGGGGVMHVLGDRR